MHHLMGEPKKHMELVSAYFVPTQRGADYLSKLSKDNIQVRVLTNSFAANDVAVVHAFYNKYRYELLKNGVQLYEFKPYLERKKRTWYEVMTGNVIPAKGKSASSLHAKFFDIDGIVFIGSFNFDPRSVNLNTEVGLVVESDALQNDISKILNQYLPQIAYQLKLNANNEIIWTDQRPDGSIHEFKIDPGTTRFQRFSMKAVSYLPIEWMM
jgi:putative cardiolipin synthase